MKWSLGTAAVVGTIFCLLTFGRNDEHGAPNGSPLIAQQPAEKAKQAQADPFGEPSTGKPALPQIFEPNSGKSVKKATDDSHPVDMLSARLEKELNNATAFAFQGASLEEIAEDIRARHKIEIQIDKAALEEAQFDSAIRFDKQIAGVRLRTALELLLRDNKLRYQNYDGVLLITTEAKAKENLMRRVYPRKGAFAQIEARQVYALLVTTIYPDTWRSGGGRGAVNILPDRIVISNSDAVHRELDALYKQNDEISPYADAKTKNDTFTEADAGSLMQAGGGWGNGNARPKTSASTGGFGGGASR